MVPPADGAIGGRARFRTVASCAAIVVGPLAIVLMPVPVGVTPQGWRLFAIFVGTILGLILQPLPIGATVFMAVTIAALTGALSPAQALAGYADPLVWMVFAAFCIARGMIKTGLGRRIALYFIRAVGRTSLGLGYAVVVSDMVLGTAIPSVAARAGGIVFPIVKSLAEAYDSRPGPTGKRLGTFLMLMVYHCDVTVAAMFLTGNVSNPLIASLAKQVTGIDISYSTWALGALAPAAVSMLVVPLLLYRMLPPTIKETPAAARMAEAELARLGPLAGAEKLMLGVFGLVTVLWLTKAWHGIDYPVVALVGMAVLLLGGVLTWDDVLAERAGWDVFVWFGGIYQLSRALSDTGVMQLFVQATANTMAGAVWWSALGALLIVYFYSHYMFASITARASAMYVPFVVVVIAAGAPPYLAVLSLGYISALAASLTHYGTTTSPIYYGAGYLSQATWWRVGLIVATVNGVIWIAVGSLWWKLLGWW
jgi:divalent anion:Na+ symporter, DASS family